MNAHTVTQTRRRRRTQTLTHTHTHTHTHTNAQTHSNTTPPHKFYFPVTTDFPYNSITIWQFENTGCQIVTQQIDSTDSSFCTESIDSRTFCLFCLFCVCVCVCWPLWRYWYVCMCVCVCVCMCMYVCMCIYGSICLNDVCVLIDCWWIVVYTTRHTHTQVNVSYPPTGQQRSIIVEDDNKLYVHTPHTRTHAHAQRSHEHQTLASHTLRLENTHTLSLSVAPSWANAYLTKWKAMS